MSWKLEIASNAAASSWTDRTSIVDRHQILVGGNARRGEIGTCGFVLDDDAAAITLPSRRVVRVVEDATTPDTVLERGRIVEKSVNRGTSFTGDARQYDVEIQDYNVDLSLIVVDQWSRPEETDVARVLALASAYLAGSPRASTDLDTTYVADANTVTLPKKKYEATNPTQILSDIAEEAGKEFFVTTDGELFYDLPTSTAYAAGLSITDVSPDLETSFPPEWEDTPAQQDGSELFHQIVGIWGTSGTRTTVSDSSVATAHDYAETSVYIDAKNSTEATQKLTAMLGERKVEEERIACTINLRPDQVDLVKRGQTLSYRAAASAITTPRTLRVVRLMWQPPDHPEGLYKARMELGFPKKLAARTKKGSPPAPGPFEPQMETTPASAKLVGLHDHDGTVQVYWSDGETIVGPFSYDTAPVVSGDPGDNDYQSIVALADGVIDVTADVSFSAVFTGDHTASYKLIIAGVVVASAGDIFTGAGPYFAGGRSYTLSATNYPVRTGDAIWVEIAISGTVSIVMPGGGGPAICVAVTGDMETGTVLNSPQVGSRVTESATGDGSTTTFGTNYPYQPNSLEVSVGGTRVVPTQTDPDAGTFSLPFVPPTGSQVLITYLAADSVETGAGNNPHPYSDAPTVPVGVLPAEALLKTMIDAKGDLIVGTADDTATRLPAGTDGYGLVARSSAATGLAYEARDSAPCVVIDGGGSVIATGGPKAGIPVPFPCTVVEWRVESVDGISTTSTFDVKKRAYGGGAATSMVGAGTKPGITAGTENKAAPSGWTTTSISAGDVLYPHLDANNNAKLLALTLTLRRT